MKKKIVVLFAIGLLIVTVFPVVESLNIDDKKSTGNAQSIDSNSDVVVVVHITDFIAHRKEGSKREKINPSIQTIIFSEKGIRTHRTKPYEVYLTKEGEHIKYFESLEIVFKNVLLNEKSGIKLSVEDVVKEDEVDKHKWKELVSVGGKLPLYGSKVYSAKSDYIDISITVSIKESYNQYLSGLAALEATIPKDNNGALNRGLFQARIGIRNESKSLLELEGQCKDFRGGHLLSGTVTLTDTGRTTRFQGLTIRNLFIIQSAVRNRILNIVGKSISYDEEEQIYSGMWRGFAIGVESARGWIAANFI